MPKKIYHIRFTSQLLGDAGVKLLNVAASRRLEKKSGDTREINIQTRLLELLEDIWVNNAAEERNNHYMNKEASKALTIQRFFAPGVPDMLMRYFLLLGQQQDLSPQVNGLPLQLVITSEYYRIGSPIPTEILSRLVTYWARHYAARQSAAEAKQSYEDQDGSSVEQQINANISYIRAGFEQFKSTLGADLPAEASQATAPTDFAAITRELEAVEPGALSNSPDVDQKQRVAPAESLFFQPQVPSAPSWEELAASEPLEERIGSSGGGAVEMQIMGESDQNQEVDESEVPIDQQPMLDQKEEKNADNSPDLPLDMLNEYQLFFLLVTQYDEALQKAKSSTSNQDKRKSLDASLRDLAQIRTNWDFGAWGLGLSTLTGDQKNSIAGQALELDTMLKDTQRALKAHSSPGFFRTLLAQPAEPRSYAESKGLFEKASETSAALLGRLFGALTPSH